MKHKPGDVVTVRSDLKRSQMYDDVYVTVFMESLAGKEVRIAARLRGGYTISGDVHGHLWTDEMFEPSNSEITVHLEELYTWYRQECHKEEVKPADFETFKSNLRRLLHVETDS